MLSVRFNAYPCGYHALGGGTSVPLGGKAGAPPAGATRWWRPRSASRSRGARAGSSELHRQIDAVALQARGHELPRAQFDSSTTGRFSGVDRGIIRAEQTANRSVPGGRRIPTRVVTISHATGAGGETIGRTVADRLGFRYIDEEIITLAAEKEEGDAALVADTERRKSFLAPPFSRLPKGPVDVGGVLVPEPVMAPRSENLCIVIF